jgi:biofilm PGA synthesis N-glycosyltransferase PgaC
VRRLQSDSRLGGATGNPRIRNRSSMLGRLQVGEFSSIIGLIKRAQTVYGRIFTVSGVMCAFRKRALQDAGWWLRETITDDVDLSWRVQLAGWQLVYEPKAICWILMPETLKGLWRQRLRWAIGGTQAVFVATRKVLFGGSWELLSIWANYLASILWAYCILGGMALWVVHVAIVPLHPEMPISNPIPGFWGAVLAVTYLLQAVVSVILDRRFESGVHRAIFWIVWYPLIFWTLQALTAAVALPKALLRPSGMSGTWTSPDRGLR